MIKLPKPLIKAVRRGYIVAIIHFGSSLYCSVYHDIDLAVVVKRSYYKKLLKEIRGKIQANFDIALIRQEEITGAEEFRWGGHGAHFLKSLIEGEAVYGLNPFLKFSVSDSQLKASILSRLYDYMEDVRRAALQRNIKSSIKKRWPKFIRLSLYLLEDGFTYPGILNLSESELAPYFKKHKIDTNKVNLLLEYEAIWKKVLNTYRLVQKIKRRGKHHD